MTNDIVFGEGIRLLGHKRLVTQVYPKNGPFTHFKVDGKFQTREQCIADIEKRWQNYWTCPPADTGVAGAQIRVCRPEGTFLAYLRTDEDEVGADNLGELPLIPANEIPFFTSN